MVFWGKLLDLSNCWDNKCLQKIACSCWVVSWLTAWTTRSWCDKLPSDFRKCWTLMFVLQVTVDNDESDESYESSWSYMQHIQSNAFLVHDRRTFHKEVTNNKVCIHKYSLCLFFNSNEINKLYLGSDQSALSASCSSFSFHICCPGLPTYNPEE